MSVIEERPCPVILNSSCVVVSSAPSAPCARCYRLSSSTSAPAESLDAGARTARNARAISALRAVGGEIETYNVPACEAEEVRRRVELHRRFGKVAAMITDLNLHRWLRCGKPTKKGKSRSPRPCSGVGSKPMWTRSLVARPGGRDAGGDSAAAPLEEGLGRHLSRGGGADPQPAPTGGGMQTGSVRGADGGAPRDTMGYALERQAPAPVFALGCEVARV